MNLKQEKKIIIDLSGIKQIDSTGVGLLVSGHVLACVEESKLVLAGAGPRVEELMELSNLDTLLTLRPSVEEAIKAFG